MRAAERKCLCDAQDFPYMSAGTAAPDIKRPKKKKKRGRNVHGGPVKEKAFSSREVIFHIHSSAHFKEFGTLLQPHHCCCCFVSQGHFFFFFLLFHVLGLSCKSCNETTCTVRKKINPQKHGKHDSHTLGNVDDFEADVSNSIMVMTPHANVRFFFFHIAA